MMEINKKLAIILYIFIFIVIFLIFLIFNSNLTKKGKTYKNQWYIEKTGLASVMEKYQGNLLNVSYQ